MARLTWNVQGAVSVSITPGIGAVAASGEQNVYPSVTTDYKLTGINKNGSTSILHVSIDPTPLTITPNLFTGSNTVGVNNNIAVANLLNGPFNSLNLLSGSLPPGMALNIVGKTLMLTGAGSTVGTFAAVFQVIGPAGSANFTLNFQIAAVSVGSTPVGNPTGSTPTGSTPVGSTPVGTPTGVVPTGSPVGVTPVGSPVGSTPVGTPVGTPTGVVPTGSPVGVTPVGSPTGVVPTGSPVGVTPVGSPVGTPVG